MAISIRGKPTSELRDVTCHMGSDSVTCHPTGKRALPKTGKKGWYPGTQLTYPGEMVELT